MAEKKNKELRLTGTVSELRAVLGKANGSFLRYKVDNDPAEYTLIFTTDPLDVDIDSPRPEASRM